MSSSDSDLEHVLSIAAAATTCFMIFAAVEKKRRRKRGGSRPGKRRNRNMLRTEGAVYLDRDYFCREGQGSPLFSEEEFERRFGVTRQIYENVRAAVCDYDNYFEQRPDATGLLGASTDQTLTAGFRQLSMGITADVCVDYARNGESLNLKSLTHLVRGIVACFEVMWLRYPNEEEILQIERTYSKHGFPGCLGTVDCAFLAWDKCPVAWQGQYKGMNKKPNCRLEVVCDDKLRIWHLMFGAPGAKNDKSILNQNTLFNAIHTDQWPPFRPRVCIAGYTLSWFYYLADGIYPDFTIFAKPHPDPKTLKERLYCAYQSCARKSVERVFAVLFAQFEILARPSRLFHLEDMS